MELETGKASYPANPTTHPFGVYLVPTHFPLDHCPDLVLHSTYSYVDI